MDDLGVRAELGCTVDYPVIEARTDTHHHIRMVHGDVRGIAAVHAEHAEELAIGAGKAAQTHQGIGDRYAQLLAQVGKLTRSEEHTSELQSRPHLVCRLLLEKKKKKTKTKKHEKIKNKT